MPPMLPDPGLRSDRPRIVDRPFWCAGVNIRFRSSDGLAETVGFSSKVLDISGTHIQLAGDDEYRSILVSPSSISGLSGGQILFGSSSAVKVMTFDATSTPVPGTRWQIDDITGLSWDTVPDTLPNPPTGAIEVPPNVVFLPQDDLVVAFKANDNAARPFLWERDPSAVMTELSNAPLGAVGGAIINRILLLLGAQSVGETGQSDPVVAPQPTFPQRYLTCRWSDQFDFDNWNQSDVTLSGELQLDSGSRIIGGGRVREGVAVWTDEALWILSFVPDPDIIFSPKVIDGSSGLMSNQSWCETEGRVWYFDTNRRLVVYDGGSPRPIPNPCKMATIERLNETQIARSYMFANPEFDEVVLAYPTEDSENCDTQLVYNYLLDAWSIWRFPRTAWHRRKGNINAIAVSPGGHLYWHDIDSGIGDDYLIPPSYVAPASSGLPEGTGSPASADVEPFSFALFTNPFTSGDVTGSTLRETRLHWNMVAAPAVGSEADTITVHSVGYGISQIKGAPLTTDVVRLEVGDLSADIRVAGKALQLGVQGAQVKTQIRFGEFSLTVKGGGPR